MRLALLLALAALVFGCNSEATVCPNPAACGTTGDAITDATSDTPLDSGVDTALDSSVGD